MKGRPVEKRHEDVNVVEVQIDERVHKVVIREADEIKYLNVRRMEFFLPLDGFR